MTGLEELKIPSGFLVLARHENSNRQTRSRFATCSTDRRSHERVVSGSPCSSASRVQSLSESSISNEVVPGVANIKRRKKKKRKKKDGYLSLGTE